MNIAIIGAGNMGGAIARGLVSAGYTVSVSNPSSPALEALASAFPAITVGHDNCEAAAGADIVFIATRPDTCQAVLDEITPVLNPGTLVVTMSPRHELASLPCPQGCYLARIMPNTAIAQARSMTFVTYADNVPESVRRQLVSVLGELGHCAEVPEHLFGAATALCSCGLAYAMRYVRAAAEGGVAMGFKPEDAVRYVSATLEGAVAMLGRGTHPEKLIDAVTTPGGTTIRGLLAMERAGFSNAVIEGLLASCHE